MNANASFVPPRGLRLFSGFLMGSIVFLILVGSWVTSNNAGMAVPDWPTTFGYNLFTFPINRWTGGITYEHLHRLVAEGIGDLTLVLAVWVWLRDSRSWVRYLSLGACFLVLVQAVVGGLRVLQNNQQIGIVHGILAQIFLIVAGIIALSYTPGWNEVPACAARLPRRWARGVHIVTGLIFLQLILGAAMRHQHAGLSIPDFPMAYGSLWPHVDAPRLAAINADRASVGQPETTLLQIDLQMAHRIMAVLVFAGILLCSLAIFRCRQSPSRLRNLATAWLVLVCCQVGLGAATIWSQKNAVVASAHVVNGAVLLLLGSRMAALLGRWRRVAACVPAAPELAQAPASR